MAKDGNEIPYASKCLIHHIDERLLVEPIKILCANESEFDEKRSGYASFLPGRLCLLS